MPAVNKTCPLGQFGCADGRCIFARYQCDRFPDCLDGSDETAELCGEDPCRDRIKCGTNGRCIPISWCCHRPQSAPDGPYDCDIWQQQICCSRRSIWNAKVDQTSFMGGTMENGRLSGYGCSDPKKCASSANGHDAMWGFQAAVFVMAGCTLAFVALILLAAFIGAKYLVRKLHRQQELLDGERNGCSHHRLRHSSLNTVHRCRSYSAPRHSSGGRAAVHLLGSRGSISDNEVRCVYYVNGTRRCSHHRCGQSRYRRSEPSCSILLQYPSQRTGSICDAGTESPPPPYADLGDASRPPPAYGSLPTDSNIDDGLPGYTSALQLLEGNTSEVNQK